MKMFNHLKHLTLNKVYLKYFGIPQESFEVAQNPGKLETSPGNKFGEKDTLNAYLLTPQTYPFFWFWPFWHPKRVTRVTRHYRQKVPFLRVFLVARVYSHIVEWPPRGLNPVQVFVLDKCCTWYEVQDWHICLCCFGNHMADI